MSYYVELDNEARTGGDVASIGGWGDFSRYIERRRDRFSTVWEFIEHGQTTQLDGLERELQALVRDTRDEDTTEVARALLRALEERGEAEHIYLLDGIEDAGEEEADADEP